MPIIISLAVLLCSVCFASAIGGAKIQDSFISDFETVNEFLRQGTGFASREKLMASLISHIPNQHPHRPLCIVAASSGNSSAPFGLQLAQSILQSSSRALNLSGAEIEHLSGHVPLRHLQHAINAHFRNDSSGSVVISDVNKLHPQDVTKAIWEFCDDDEAPFKHAVFVFTAQIPGLDDCEEEEAIEAAVRQYFENLWGKIVTFDPFWVRAARIVVSTSQCQF